MDKRGAAATDLLLIVGYSIIIISAMLILLSWVNSASDNLAQKQIIAKQTALILNLARPGTEITVNKDVLISGQTITFDISRYFFFNNKAITTEKLEGGSTRIIVSNG